MTRRHRGRRARTITTAAGDVRLSRIYFECLPCRDGACLLDRRIGVDGRYSRNAQRLICLAASSWSYDLSSDRMEEFCGLKVSDTTIRRVAQEHGTSINEWLRNDPEAVREFREQTGDTEFTTDGTCVNTTKGWREMKVAIFSKRNRGECAGIEDWASRVLPAPKTRIAFAAIECSDRFGSRWKAWRKRLGLADTSSITVLADGAKWIWDEQRQHLPGADGVLDIFHAVEHLAATSRVLYEDSAKASSWLETARVALLKDGYFGIYQLCQAEKTVTPEQAVAVDQLLSYLAPHEQHLHFAQRLEQGRSIGSGQIEGACKNLIGRRLKANAARWRVRRVNRMAGLCSLMYSHQWQNYWNAS